MASKNIFSNEYKISIGDAYFLITLDNSFKERKLSKYDAGLISTKNIHFHSSHELFFVPNSQVFINIGEKEYSFSNCAINIVPLFSHYSMRFKNSYRLLFTFKNKKGSQFKLYDDFEQLFSNNMQPLRINKKIVDQLEYISATDMSNNFASHEAISCSLKIVFLELYKLNCNHKNKEHGRTNENYLFQIEQIISAKYNENVDLSYVAKVLHLSTKQVSRVIKNNYKDSLNVLITKRRLQVASSLLLETDMTISQIIEEVNFKSSNYFYVCFKNEYGMSPAEYKKEHYSGLLSKSNVRS